MEPDGYCLRGGSRGGGGFDGLFFLSVAVWFLVLARLFDRRLALFGCAAVLLTDLMWQFSLSALPQMLVLFLFSLATLCTLFGIEAREEGV